MPPAEVNVAVDDVLHIASPADGDAALATSAIRPASLESEGFVHCSTRAQCPATLARHFPGAGHLVLLVLDPAVLGDALRWEEGRPGEVFPHVYAPIPLDAVTAVEHVTAPGT
jgi:uncharacterized protein (DUF952 family)